MGPGRVRCRVGARDPAPARRCRARRARNRAGRRDGHPGRQRFGVGTQRVQRAARTCRRGSARAPTGCTRWERREPRWSSWSHCCSRAGSESSFGSRWPAVWRGCSRRSSATWSTPRASVGPPTSAQAVSRATRSWGSRRRSPPCWWCRPSSCGPRCRTVLAALMVGATGAVLSITGLPIDVAGSVVLGWGVAAAMNLIFGTPAATPTLHQVSDALFDVGIHVSGLQLASRQVWGEARFVASGPDNEPVSVDVLGRERGPTRGSSRSSSAHCCTGTPARRCRSRDLNSSSTALVHRCYSPPTSACRSAKS